MATKLKHLRVKDRAAQTNLGGRPQKPNKEEFGQITCVLRLDTIQRLKDGSGSKHFGDFLQHHLDKYPVPSRAQYLAMTHNVPYYTLVKRRKVPTLIAAGSLSKESKKLAKERARRESLSPQERAWEDATRADVTKIVEEVYAGNKS